MTARRMRHHVRLTVASHAPTCGNMWMCVCVWEREGAQTNPTVKSRLNIYKNLNKSVSTCRAGAYWVKELHTQEPPVSAVINRLQLILAVNDQRVWVVVKEKSRKTYPLVLNSLKNQKFLKFSTSCKCELCVCCRNFATSWWNGPEAASASSQRSKRVAVLQYGNIFSNRISYSLKTHVYLLTVWFAHIVLFVVDCLCYSYLETSIRVKGGFMNVMFLFLIRCKCEIFQRNKHSYHTVVTQIFTAFVWSRFYSNDT